MRYFPSVVVAMLLFLAPVFSWAQKLSCSPCSYNFGNVQVGSSKAYSFKLTNTGSARLYLSQPRKAPGYTLSHLPWKILAKQSVEFMVTYDPITPGQANAAIKIANNLKTPLLTINVRGNGVSITSRRLTISPATLNFGNVNVGSSSSLRATLTASNAAVTISSDRSTSSEFAVLGVKLPLTIASGNSVPVTIQFIPNASGTASAKVGFISNAANSPTIEELNGTGLAQHFHQVDLSWDRGTGTAVGYNLYRSTAQGGPFAKINAVLDATSSYTDSTVVSGKTYYYVTTEVDTKGHESAYSNVAKAVIPTP
jgi:Protein of unknown function (DUF1573)/Abnormal spindle-like microcephaly-assoc'd, ASPM-SPD-2-Hydin